MTAVDTDDFDPHALDEQDFLDEVHSFQFWFDSIEGYLTDRPYGRLETTVEEVLDDARRERLITSLCNYCVGETAALEGPAGLVQLAPDRSSQIFMATQVVDEARHLEVFLHRLRELGVADPEREIERRAQPALVDFKGALLELVDQGDWHAALFAQKVILETMEYPVFRLHAAYADPVTKDVLAGVIAAIGCRQGMEVGGDVESLGRGVTSAVVQAIFATILIDAIFAVIYMKLDL